MKIHEKLRAMRQFKNWTQEELADKLGWAVNSYAKIERGEADIKLDKLKGIAKVMGVDIQDLVSVDDKTVLNFAENCSHSNNAHCTIILTETECAHELEKAQILLRERNNENKNLLKQIERLEEIINLLKNKT